MNSKRIRHFGIVVHDADQACETWCNAFGMTKAADMQIAEEGIRSVFVSIGGTLDEMAIELMEPLDKQDLNNAVARRLAPEGRGLLPRLPRGRQRGRQRRRAPRPPDARDPPRRRGRWR